MSFKMVRTLSDISSSAVAELLTKCLITSESEGRGIREYCDILRALGQIRNVADRTFDKLAQLSVTDEDWRQAYEALVDDNLTHWRIKRGWNKGPGLTEKLKMLGQLQTINISGCADDILFSLLSLHCPKLRAVTASHSPDLSDAGLASLETRDRDNSDKSYPSPRIQRPAAGKNRLEANNESDSMPATEISTKSVEPTVFQVARQEFENVEEEDSVRGFSQTRLSAPCPLLTSLVVTGCPLVSVEAVTRLLASRPGLRHLGHDHLGLVYQSLLDSDRMENSGTRYQIQNYEQTLTRDSSEEDEDLTSRVARACPNIRTARIRSDKDDDKHLRHLVTMSELHEVIIDSASLGPGFSALVHGSGSRLSQLALSLQVFTSDNMKIISEECRNLKILHLFFTSFIQSSHDEHLYFSAKLEGLFLGVTKSCDVDRVHKCLTSNILPACAFLRSLFLSGVSALFDDEFLETVVSGNNSLRRLECVGIKIGALLTEKSLQNLLKYCLNLEKIDASSWNVSQADLNKIRSALTRRGHHVQIL